VVRHGKLINPHNILYGDTIEMELSPEGKEQIKLLAQSIKKNGPIPTKIYTSFLERTVESSNILAEVLHVDNVQIEKDLRDSHVPGVAGKPKSVRLELHKNGRDEYEGEFLKTGGESRKDIVDRMYGVFKRAFDENAAGCSALVSHGDPIRLLLYKIENPQSSEIESMAKLASFDYLPKGCAWKLELDSQGSLLSKTLIESGEE